MTFELNSKDEENIWRIAQVPGDITFKLKAYIVEWCIGPYVYVSVGQMR